MPDKFGFHIITAVYIKICSMVVTLHDRITSLVVLCSIYIYIKISDLKASHWHGKIMVTTWLHLSVEMFYLAIHVQ